MDAIQRALVRSLFAWMALSLTTETLLAQSRPPRRRPGIPGLTLRAYDGPNRANETDLAAGRLVDSLFESDAPADPLTGGMADAAGEALGIPRSEAIRRGGWQGRLAVNPDPSDGSPPFVLLDRYGGVKRFVEPSARVDLESHLGEMVEVRRDTGHTLLASQLNLPRLDRSIDLAQYSEEIPPGAVIDGTEGPMIVPEGVDPVYLDDGMNFGGCDSCGSGICDGGCYRRSGCGFGSRPVLYVRGEYLQWWFDGMNTPPLVDRFNNTPGATPEEQNVQTVVGNTGLLNNGRNGARVIVGLWFDDYGKWGIEGDYYSFENITQVFSDGGNGESDDPAVGRPLISAQRGRVEELVSALGLAGTVTVTADSQFATSSVRLRHNLCCAERCAPACGDGVTCGDCVGCGYGVGCGSGVGCRGRWCPLLTSGVRRTDFLFGLRHAQLEENLRIAEDLLILDPPPVNTRFDADDVDTRIRLFDNFATSNEFVGIDLGYVWEWEYQRWSLELLSRIAFGNTRQRVAINGMTTIGTPVAGTGTPPDLDFNDEEGGILTQRTPRGNIGIYERDQFSVLPEIGATVGFNVTSRLRLTLGYTLLYWSRVVRPGDQIDLVVNEDNIPFQSAGDPSEPFLPAFAFHDTAIWAQGINLGAQYIW